jgi:hypothetical protein
MRALVLTLAIICTGHAFALPCLYPVGARDLVCETMRAKRGTITICLPLKKGHVT